MLKKPGRRGFTLIELLVVIAIIAILAAILFPVFAQAREKARQASCLANNKQIGNALIMYAQDYDEGLPAWEGGLACRTGKTAGVIPAAAVCPADFDSRFSWDAVLLPYVKNGTQANVASATGAAPIGGVWSCPSSKHKNMRSMGYSTCLAIRPTPLVPANYYRWPKLQEIDEPAGTVFVGDAGTGTGVGQGGGRIGRPIDLQAWWERRTGVEPTREHSYRHNDGANYVFTDGHAKWMKWEVAFPASDNGTTLTGGTRNAHCAQARYFAATQDERASAKATAGAAVCP